MKKILSLLLGVILLGSLTGCGTSEKGTVKEPQKQKEKVEVKNSIPEMELQEAFEVNTENGNYLLTINSIHTTEKRNEFVDEQPKQVILVDYEYENKDFESSSGGKLYIDEYAFVAMDGEGNVLRSYPYDIDKMPQEVPVGGKCSATISYSVPSDSKIIKLQFERNGKAIGEMIVDIE